MNTYVVGDVQGCADELEQLLEAVRFDPSVDELWLAGDLVNRGPKSAHTLRIARSLGKACVAILGNHDLSILADAYTLKFACPQKSTTQEILAAPDGPELIDWLRTRPVAHAAHDCLMVHAGLAPEWSSPQTLSYARELESVLAGPDYVSFLNQMYGDDPIHWNDELAGMERLRFITNCLTRLRYCDATDGLALAEKDGPHAVDPRRLTPWFAVPHRASRDTTILFGHWSTLGQIHWPQHRVWGLDTGCVWGGRLTALHLQSRRLIQVPSRGHKKPGGG